MCAVESSSQNVLQIKWPKNEEVYSGLGLKSLRLRLQNCL